MEIPLIAVILVNSATAIGCTILGAALAKHLGRKPADAVADNDAVALTHPVRTAFEAMKISQGEGNYCVLVFNSGLRAQIIKVLDIGTHYSSVYYRIRSIDGAPFTIGKGTIHHASVAMLTTPITEQAEHDELHRLNDKAKRAQWQ